MKRQGVKRSESAPSRSAAAPVPAPKPDHEPMPLTVTKMYAVLAALLVCFLALAAIHASIVPTGWAGYQDAPDEAAHVTYIRALASGVYPSKQHPTSAADTKTPFAYEWHQPPLYYATALPFYAIGGEHGARYASILFGICAILLVFYGARALFPADPAVALLAAAFAALTPGHISICSTVNNDSLLEVCFSGALLALILSLQTGFTMRRACLLGVALGCAIITKLTGLLLLPVVGVALLFMSRFGQSRRELLRGVIAATGIAAAISGWWFVRNALLYGQVIPIAAFNASFAGTAQAASMADAMGGWGQYLATVGWGVFRSFWAVYGTANDAGTGYPRFLPDQVYMLTAIITLGAAAGLGKLHFTWRSSMSERQVAALRTLLAALGVVAVSFLLFVLKYFQEQGRYLYPVMLPIAIVLALGWRTVLPPRYFGLAAVMIAALLLALSVQFLRIILPA